MRSEDCEHSPIEPLGAGVSLCGCGGIIWPYITGCDRTEDVERTILAVEQGMSIAKARALLGYTRSEWIAVLRENPPLMHALQGARLRGAGQAEIEVRQDDAAHWLSRQDREADSELGDQGWADKVQIESNSVVTQIAGTPDAVKKRLAEMTDEEFTQFKELHEAQQRLLLGPKSEPED